VHETLNGPSAGLDLGSVAAAVKEQLQLGRGEVPDCKRVTHRFTPGAEVSDDTLATIQRQYEAFAQRAGIYPTDLIFHISCGNAVIWSPYRTEDFFVGQFIGEIFAVSHFAPSNPKAGYRAMLDLLNTQTPVVFAVPEHLADQLTRLGFREGKIIVPMEFRGVPQLKHILINHAFNPDDLNLLATWYLADLVERCQRYP
jgi:hypothetical protein